MRPRFEAFLVLSLAIAFTTSCVIVRSVRVDSMTAEEAIGTEVRTPLKVFHTDGTITVFADGARVDATAVVGTGQRYSLDLATAVPVGSVPLDDVVGIEAFQNRTHVGATLVTSLLATAAVVVGGVAIACAFDPKCFGSCPTIYTYEDGEEVLEAEAFSYSIAPLLESRDVDRLGTRPDADGILRLEVRNEALETHYINHVEILEARHAPGRRAYPNESGRVLSVGPAMAPMRAADRDGHARVQEIVASDGVAFASTEARVRAVTADDPWDHLDLTFARPSGESAALVLRLRNSLLNSILFYDLMLGSHGAEALDWLGRDMNRIGEAVELGDWFSEIMGLRISVLMGDRWEEVARVGDTGPITWKELAVALPMPSRGDEIHVRLTFLADEWRIDSVGLATEVERASVERHPVSRIGRIGEVPDDGLRRRHAEPDEDYLVTSAGTAVYLEFDPTPGVPDEERTFFFSSQGYYTEWIRPDWIRSAPQSEGFSPSPELVVDLMDRWLAVKDDFERRFYETRIPVR